MNTREITALIVFILIVLASPLFTLGTIRKILRIRRTPPYSIALLPSEGQGIIRGRTKGRPIQSPLTGDNCLLWKIKVDELQGGGKGSRWVKIYENLSASPIMLCDDSGEIPLLINTVDLDVNFRKYPDGLFGSMTPNIREAVEKLGVKTKGFLGFNKRLRATEYFVDPGEDIFTIGDIDYVDGRKAIISKANRPLFISNRTEKEVLTGLYWRLALNLLLILLIDVVIGVVILSFTSTV
jgi:hypothetical protein